MDWHGFNTLYTVLMYFQMAPGVLVRQVSLDVEQFCHEMAQRLCTEAGKKYFFCNDYNVEIVDVSQPHVHLHIFTCMDGLIENAIYFNAVSVFLVLYQDVCIYL